MATYNFSQIADGQVIAFNPTADVIFFDNGSISAGLGSVSQVGSNLLFRYGGKSFTLQNVLLAQLTTNNVRFSNGSLLLVGDNTTSTTGDDGANNLRGGAQADLLYGLAGNDTLDGATGADVMIGGDGSDTYIVDNIGDQVNETNPTQASKIGDPEWDVVRSSVTYTLGANVEQLILTGTNAIDGAGNNLRNVIIGNDASNKLQGGDNSDTLLGGGGDDTLDGGRAGDSMEGGDGNDIYAVDDVGDIVVETSGAAAGGIDTVQSSISYTLPDNVENLILLDPPPHYTPPPLRGTGNTLNNRLVGNSGPNRLDGVTGADTMEGGNAQDVYLVNSADDLVIETNTSTAVSEIDLVESTISYSLPDNVEWLQLMGTANINATGNALNNLFVANIGNNVFNGGSGNDTLSYSVTSPYITFINSIINQTQLINSTAKPALAGVKVSLAITGSQNTLGSGTDTLVDIENLIGSCFNDHLTGNAGANVLDGGEGADVLVGGDGNDIYYVDGADVVIETNSDPRQIDIIRSLVNYVLPANVENLELIGNGNINGTGNELQNVITGNSAANLLDGAGGADRLEGGAGNDTYLVDGFDTVVEAANAGTDTIMTEVGILGDALPANVENLLLLGSRNLTGKGNSLGNIIWANVGDNVLDGVGGTGDTLSYEFGATSGVRVSLSILNAPQETGGSGRDTLVGSGFQNLAGSPYDDFLQGTTGDNVLDGLGGNDTVSYEDSATRGVSIDLTVEGKAQDTGGSGRDTLRSIENLIGSSYDDLFIASVGNNVLDGKSGTDTVSYAKSNGSVRVSLDVTTPQSTGGSGRDTLLNIENLIGSNYNDTLIGNINPNRLDGGKGTDTLQGGGGDDLYIVDDVGDVVIEMPGQGRDTIQSTVDLTLPANVENLELQGDTKSGANNGTGNELNNVLSGNARDNLLNGLGGNDTINGGGGKDTLTGGAGSDWFAFSLVSDTTVTRPDVITDFNRTQGDKIDLSLPNFYSGEFTFIGTAPFSGIAGQLRYEIINNTTTLVTGDTNGDRVADFAIELTGTIPLQATDFML